MDLASQENLRRAQRWDKGIKIGEGTFANVYKGKEKKTGVEVAIKKIKVGAMKDGLDVTALREVKFLQELHHPNIISLLDVFSVKQNIHLVLEFLDTDLEAVIKDKALIFQQGDIKSWTLMTLRGLEYIHRYGVLHRDLKPNNLLIDRNGELKIADFGLAREFGEAGHRMTCQVITLWYRPPELLWGARHYSTAVDMWSVGTIFVELIWRAPYLPGNSDVDQMKRIMQMMGSPDEATWPGFKDLPDYYDMSGHPKTEWWTVVASLGEDAMNLLKEMLHLGPAGRPTAAKALRHRYFTSLPRPTAPRKLPKPTAELRPRAMAPDETQGKPPLTDVSDDNSMIMKRKAEDPAPRSGGEEGRRVARKLFA